MNCHLTKQRMNVCRNSCYSGIVISSELIYQAGKGTWRFETLPYVTADTTQTEIVSVLDPHYQYLIVYVRS
jgi:hypothetical protein